MREIKLVESKIGSIKICDKDIHKAFWTPDGCGPDFSKELENATEIYIRFPNIRFPSRCPCCGKPRDEGGDC